MRHGGDVSPSRLIQSGQAGRHKRLTSLMFALTTKVKQMIEKTTCRLLGTLAKTHGTDGSMLLRLKDSSLEISNQPKFLFIEADGLLVPFSVTSLEWHHAREMIVALKEAGTSEIARQYAGCSIWIKAEDLKGEERRLPQEDIRDYLVVDRHKGPAGTVVELLDIARNPLLKIIQEGKEYLVPFHEDIVLKIDKRKKTITVDLPEGITEI